MASLDPLLGRQILDVEPRRPGLVHRLSHRRGQAASECLKHDLCDFAAEGVAMLDVDAFGMQPMWQRAELGNEFFQDVEAIDQEPDAKALIKCESSREAPGHCRVTEIVDDAADDVDGAPALRKAHE